MVNDWRPKSITELRNAHRGQDIWLIASGKSLDYVDPAFFRNKVAVALNRAYIRFHTQYLVCRDNNWFDELYEIAPERGAMLIAARKGSRSSRPGEVFDNLPKRPNGYSVYQFTNGIHRFDLDTINRDDDEMIGGHSSICCAVHVCAYLGASNIILCGADAGMLDGKRHFDGYREGTTLGLETTAQYLRWLAAVEQQVLQTRERVMQVYGCGVASLNPFVNLGLEGHRYEHA